MNTSSSADESSVRAPGTDELMPVLAGLDTTATQLETAEEVTPGHVTTYQLQTQHARHLLYSHGLDPADVQGAEREYRGEGDRGYAARGLDHALHPRHIDPTPPAGQHATEQSIDEDVDL